MKNLSKYCLRIIAIVISILSLNESVFSACPDYINGYTTIGQQGDYIYFLSDDEMSWDQAAATCIANGGSLATITDQQLNIFLQNSLNRKSAFIGYNDAAAEGAFGWHSNQPSSYNQLFATNSPAGDFVSLNFWDGTWTLNRPSTKLRFLMEVYCLEDLPDLTISNFSIPIQAEPATAYDVTYNLDNIGNSDAANNYDINLYLSTDAVLSQDDIPAGTLMTGFTGINASDFVDCEECLYIPWDLPSGNYFVILKIDADNSIFELSEANNTIVSDHILSVGGAAFGEPCHLALGNFANIYCMDFDENGAITVSGKTTDGDYLENYYSALGVLESSQPFTGSTTFEIYNNTIIEKDVIGNTISSTPIDPDIVTLYTTGDNLFGEVKRSMNGEFHLIGRIVGPAPAPYEPWDSSSYEPTSDEFYLHLLDSDGNEINSVLIGNLAYSNRDIFFVGLEDVFEYRGIIPYADDNAEAYITKINTLVGISGSSSYRFVIDYEQQTSGQTEVASSSIYSTNANHSIQPNFCNETHFQTINSFGTWSPHGSSGYTNTSFWDYSVSPANLYKRTYAFDSNTQGQGEREYYLALPLANGKELQCFRNVPVPESLLPGEFIIREMSIDSTIVEIGTIYLTGLPQEIYELPDGSFNVLAVEGGSIAVSNSDCLPPPSLVDSPQNFQIPNQETQLKVNKIYPNPASEFVFIAINNEVAQDAAMTILDGQGKLVFSKSITLDSGNSTHEIDISNFPIGIYYIQIENVELTEANRFIKL